MATTQSVAFLADQINTLTAVLNSIAVGVVVCNREGNLVFFNPEAERILGMGLTDAAPNEWTTRYGCYLPDMVTIMPAEGLPLARALRGEQAARELIFIRNPRQPAGVWIDVTAKPLLDDAGRLCGAVAVFSDVSVPQSLLRQYADHAASAEWDTCCDGVSDRFARFRELYGQLCKVVEQTADSILITNTRGTIQYVNPAFEATTGYSAAEVLGRTPRVLKSGKHDEPFYRDLWDHLAAGRPFRGTLVNRKKCGELYWSEQTISPIRDDRGVVTHFVSVMKDVTALREKQQQEVYMQLAREVQQRYYSASASVPGLDIAAAAHPAGITGGDYFDFIPQPDGSLYIVIADIAGHGFGAAFVMAETRATLRAYATVVPDVPSLLGCVNRSLVPSLGGNRFVTMFIARLDPRNRLMEYASAGHEPGWVLKRSGEIGAVLGSTAPPLGLFPGQEFGPSQAVALEEGDTIVLLTDGITETANEDEMPLGAEAAIDFVRRHPESGASDLVRGLYELTRSFAGQGPQCDDITSVVCRVGPRPLE